MLRALEDFCPAMDAVSGFIESIMVFRSCGSHYSGISAQIFTDYYPTTLKQGISLDILTLIISYFAVDMPVAEQSG